jgi:septal ring factor EnvC (AmiA/AmiB activator)
MRKDVLIAGVVVLLVIAGSVVAVQTSALARSDRAHQDELDAVRSELRSELATSEAHASALEAQSLKLRADLQQAQDQLDALADALSEADTSVRRLQRAYNGIVSDYERLRTLAIALAGSQGSSYFPSTYNPISCTSNQLSGITFTSCY